MRALILAAGKSTRIAARAGGIPKPLLPVAGESGLLRAIAWVAAAGWRDVWINLHYGAEQIRSAVGDGSRWGVSVRYAFEPALLGTAGAWKNLEREWTQTSLVIYGDNVMRFDLDAFLRTHRRAANALTIAAYDPDRVANTGIAGGWVVADEGGRAREFVEGRRIAGALVNAGAYLIEPEVATRLPGGFLDFGRDVLPGLARAGAVHVHELEPGSCCLGIDTPERLEAAERMINMGEARL